LVDLKSNIIELKELLTGQMPGANDLQVNHTHPNNGNGVLTMDEMERRMISSSLDRNKGNRRLAAKELNISERTLYRKIKDFGLQ
jgi:transcriptional regulator with PAS, ATPase and Fis domain